MVLSLRSSLCFFVIVSAANADSWETVCDTSRADDDISQTRCQEGHTCCTAKFSGSKLGCCPYADAVCCDNQLTCCPSGHTCQDAVPAHWPGWAAVTSCVPTAGDAAPTTGVAVCKPGPEQPMDTTQANVLVIGDSVSIGYAPHVANFLADIAKVQHAPWGGDGGAEETAYGKQCLDYFLHAPSGAAYKADLIMFNWGLHDGPQLFDYPPANVTVPGQEGSMDVYADELENITLRLKDWQQKAGGKLLFAVTSPMICKERADADTAWLNEQAKIIMTKHGVPMVNLYDAVVGECGPAPQESCLGFSGCFCPHCDSSGYEWLANTTIAPAMRKMLSEVDGTVV